VHDATPGPHDKLIAAESIYGGNVVR